MGKRSDSKVHPCTFESLKPPKPTHNSEYTLRLRLGLRQIAFDKYLKNCDTISQIFINPSGVPGNFVYSRNVKRNALIRTILPIIVIKEMQSGNLFDNPIPSLPMHRGCLLQFVERDYINE